MIGDLIEFLVDGLNLRGVAGVRRVVPETCPELPGAGY
ncbi:hypothetical protein SynBIOSU31_02078 [Synechococcus sp. BIOS-U3-1]|nr:hypothetical protein SynBIOSU31_02078 [Synechococcus sp. BIOS-U3-1]